MFAAKKTRIAHSLAWSIARQENRPRSGRFSRNTYGPTPPETLDRVALAQTQIMNDCKAGAFRARDARSFRDLHAFVDANFYGFTDDEATSPDMLSALAVDGSPAEAIDRLNRIQWAVSEWLNGGGLLAALHPRTN